MKRSLLLFAFVTFLHQGAQSQGKLIADTTLTKLVWLGEKVTGQHTGLIKLKSGWLTWKDEMITSGEFVVDMTSLKDSEGNARLEGHLRSDDFFGVVRNPESKLVIMGSTSFEKGSGTVSGILTIKGISNPLGFKAAVQKRDGGLWFFANIVIDRTKYDIRYGSGSFFDNLGDKTIFDEFKLKINLFVR